MNKQPAENTVMNTTTSASTCVSMTTHAHRFCPLLRRLGFTLIELLVVMAIVSLLLSILLPALKKARTAARMVQCQSNMRGIGTIAQIYANDYTDFLPPFCAGFNTCRRVEQGTAAANTPVDALWKVMVPYGIQRRSVEGDLFNVWCSAHRIPIVATPMLMSVAFIAVTMAAHIGVCSTVICLPVVVITVCVI